MYIESELLLNLKSFAQQWYLLTSTDEERFRKYMENFYYNNGVVGSDITKNILSSTTYGNGRVYVDGFRDIFFMEGVLTSDDDENVTSTNGKLTLP